MSGAAGKIIEVISKDSVDFYDKDLVHVADSGLI